jgi:5,10-methylenetetrahydromethanopterin reductase
MVEFWRGGGGESTATLDMARKLEAEGWDGQMFMDSQCLCADPYARMAVWAVATERLKLSPGVTNHLTRHVATTAAAAVTIQAISNGRAVLGIGRGDSALAYLGYAPGKLGPFRKALEDIQALLSGKEIAFDTGLEQGAKSLASLSLGGRPLASSLKWLPKGLPKVPVDVAATGPKVIELSAPIVEQVTFSVGAIPARVKWAIDLGDTARRNAGLTEAGISYGIQIVLVCHTDEALMREAATRLVTPLARFQVIQGEPTGPMTKSDKVNLEAIRRGYDMNKHSDVHANDKLISESLSHDFVERFAVVGTPDHCIERLLELNALGIKRFVIVGPGFYPEAVRNGPSLFAKEVIPAVKAHAK